MTEDLKCGQCGQRVRVHSGAEGTNSYIGIETEGIYVCPQGHKSNVARLPNHEGVRRCFFCPEVARPM